MTDERECITGKNQKNAYARGNLDAKGQRDHELIKEHLNEAPE